MSANAQHVANSRRLLVLGGYSLLAIAFLAVGLVPYFRSVATIRDQITASEKEIADRQATAAQLNSINRDIELISQQTRDYDRLVPANQDLGGFLAQLSEELDKAGMKDITVKNLTPNALNKSVQLPIQIHGTGTFQQFHSFLAKLESFHRKSSVSKLVIDSADPAMGGQVTVDLTLSIYNTKQSG